MSKPEWSRVRAVFEAALELADAERNAYLDAECAGDDALREHVDRLLLADSNATEAAPRIADAPPVDLVSAGLESVLVGRRIGSFEIRGVLGTGGMGTVFEAVQDSPNRAVALKTLRAGLRSEDMQRRFAYEAEVLGQLRHPAIAQIYETGTLRDDETGVALPYLAIEFVPDAAPLDRFVTERGLDLRATLELFLAVLDGVLHGHERGIVHRDLKPQNILVDEAGRPKIIDFGIARAADAETAQLTRTGQVLGTLSYMAPEQLRGDSAAIGTRADIYALGVILYQLLTGQLPFDPSDTSLTEFAQRVQNETPEPPSRRPGGFPDEGIAVELDWVTRTAMSAAPGERYASVSALAADLERFMRHEPVSVGPVTTGYLIRKFVRRHRVLATAGAVVFLAVVLGAVGMGWQWLRAEDALVKANEETKRARTVTQFYTAILQAGDLHDDDSGSREPTLRNAVDAAADRVSELDDPLVEAHVLFNLGNIKRSRGDVADSREHLERCLELRVDALGGEHRDVAEVLNSLAMTCELMKERELSRQHYERALQILESVDPTVEPMLARIHVNLGKQYGEGEDTERAERHIRRSIDVYAALQSPKPGEHATAHSHLAHFLAAHDRVDEAIDMFRESLGVYERAGRGQHPYAAMTRVSLAQQLIGRDDDEALTMLRSAHATLMRTVGADHDGTATAAQSLGRLLLAAGSAAEAEPYFVAAERFYEERYGTTDGRTMTARADLHSALTPQKKWDELVELMREVREAIRATPSAARNVPWRSVDVARLLQHAERFAESEQELRIVLAGIDGPPPDGAGAPPDDLDRLEKVVLERLIEVCEADGRPDDAAPLRERLASRRR